jgi:hypothetical protein
MSNQLHLQQCGRERPARAATSEAQEHERDARAYT